MDDAALIALMVGYALLVVGFVAIVARDPAAWATQPRRAIPWIVAGLFIAGPIGALLVLLLMRHQRNVRSAQPPPL